MSNSQIVSARCESPHSPIYVRLREPMRVRSGKIHTRKCPERVETPLTSSCTISKWTTTVIGVRNPPKSDGVRMHRVSSPRIRLPLPTTIIKCVVAWPASRRDDIRLHRFLTPSLPE
jgi:hypothetical protein